MDTSANRIKIPEALRKMREIFASHGFEAYLVGGAARDSVMGKEPVDYDVATNATPEEVSKIFRKVIPTGIAHGTVTVRLMGQSIETTTFRADGKYTDGRHPDSVRYASTIEEDLSRRDFTMNAMAADLSDGRLVDPFGGRADIALKKIRAVGSARERFMEDGLRPIRAMRFAAQTGFSIDGEAVDAMKDEGVQNVAKKISIERFRDELSKILSSPKPSVALLLLDETRMIDIFLPEFVEARGCVQRDWRAFHDFDVERHLFFSCDGAPRQKPNVRLAALLHDIGKPRAKKIAGDGGREKITFHDHEIESEKIARSCLVRLRYPSKVVDNVCHLVKHHMFNYESAWGAAAVRRFIARVGAENIEDLFDLRAADIYGTREKREASAEDEKLSAEFRARIEKSLCEESARSVKDLALNGDDLIALGVPKGREIGVVLNDLLQAALDDPSVNTRDGLSKIVCARLQSARP